jgi:hypothetical protein
MFGFNAVQLGVAAVVLVALEMVLCWASLALADGPEVKLPKLALLAVSVVAVCGALSVLVFYALVGLSADAAGGEKGWLHWGAAAAASLLLLWLVPAALYVPLVRFSPWKGAWTAGLQWLLRLFLLALIAGFVFVVLAALQIVRRGESSSRPPAEQAPLVAPSRHA